MIGLVYKRCLIEQARREETSLNFPIFLGLAALLLGGATAPARAEAAPDALQLRSWAAACFNCHGPGGHAEKGNESLAGKDAEEMFRKLMDYKGGRKPATLMHQLSKGYTDEQLKAIVGWFAAQKP